jgi:hypothetical protein
LQCRAVAAKNAGAEDGEMEEETVMDGYIAISNERNFLSVQIFNLQSSIFNFQSSISGQLNVVSNEASSIRQDWIWAIIWPVSKPFRWIAPERQEATHSPHPLHKAG